MQRVIEILHSLPILYLLIIMSSLLQPGFFTLMGVLMLVTWMIVHVVRAERSCAPAIFDYVRAARALGLGNQRDHVQAHPAQCHVLATLTFPALHPVRVDHDARPRSISSALACRGDPPRSANCSIRRRIILVAPWLGIAGFAVMAVMLSLLIFIGEAARDAFDPRKST